MQSCTRENFAVAAENSQQLETTSSVFKDSAAVSFLLSGTVPLASLESDSAFLFPESRLSALDSPLTRGGATLAMTWSHT